MSKFDFILNINFSKRTAMYYLSIPIFCFLISTAFIHPVMLFNDDWITGNQLHQLAKGSQILYNEGKYGTFENGTPFKYFIERKNVLPYTSYLPIFSLPFFWIINFLGDIFPYAIIVIWTFLSLLGYFYSKSFFSQLWKRGYLKIDFIVPVLIFIFFFLNLVYYYQYEIPTANDPEEILAVILYHLFIYSLLSVVILAINVNLFKNEEFFVLGVIVCMFCSSSLFWTTSLKDHLDVIFFVSLIIFSIIKYINSKDIWFSIITFTISGLIFWIRPEYGTFLFLSLIIGFLPIVIHECINGKIKFRILGYFSPFFTIIGAIPLFINNYCVMGNPLKFPWQLITEDYIIINNASSLFMNQNITSGNNISNFFIIINKIVDIIFKRLSFDDNLLNNLFSILFYPETLKVPIFALTPIFLLAIVLLPFVFFYLKSRFFQDEYLLIFILISISTFSVMAYLGSISGLGRSIGIYPDIRYLSPIYLPLNIIGLIILSKFDFSKKFIAIFLKTTCVFCLLGIPILILLISFLFTIYSFDELFLWINAIITALEFIIICVCFISLSLKGMGIVASNYLYILLSLLVVLPLLWQISQLILISYSVSVVDHYPPLLPAIRALFAFLSSPLTNF